MLVIGLFGSCVFSVVVVIDGHRWQWREKRDVSPQCFRYIIRGYSGIAYDYRRDHGKTFCSLSLFGTSISSYRIKTMNFFFAFFLPFFLIML